MTEKHYIKGSMDGWLRVKREPSGAEISIPDFLQVDLTESKEGRDYFVVLEGLERGKKFSVKIGNLTSAYTGFSGMAHLQFSLSKGLLTYSGGKVKAITGRDRPIPVGAHPIQIPDFPHNAPDAYTRQSRYAKTWFYLGHGAAVPGRNDRYLHTGTLSDGCITVDPAEWTQLYQYLILCRSGDGKTVGMVSVVR